MCSTARLRGCERHARYRRLLDQPVLKPLKPVEVKEPQTPTVPALRAQAWDELRPATSPASASEPSPVKRGVRRRSSVRCRSVDFSGDSQNSPLKGRLQRALALRRASQTGADVPTHRRLTKRKATCHVDIIEGRPVSKAEREKWDTAFARYQMDGEIHIDDLKGALVMCGFCDSRAAVVHKVLAGLTKFNTLNKDEFYLFVCRFEAGLHETYEFEFSQLDTCGEGTIDVLQLEQLLRRIGQPVRRFVLRELVMEVGTDGAGLVDLSGFRKIQHLIRKREGFTTKELDSFDWVFQRVDRDGSDTMSASEFANALTWLGFPYRAEKLQEFHRQSDVDGDGELSEGEFIACLRRVLDEEMEQVEAFLNKARPCTGGRLKAFIHGLGYSSSPQAILDTLSETVDVGTQASLQEMTLDLSVDDVCKVLSSLRACDGFTYSELREVKMAFNLANPEKQEQLQAPAISRALRILGHPLPLPEILRLIAEGLLDMEQQSDAFQALGLVDADGRLPRRSHGEMEGADLRVFLGIIERFKKSSLVTLRKNQGFTSVEVFELNSLFKNFDEDHDGHITKQELVGIIEVLFPLEARSKQFRPFLVQLLQEEEDCAPRSFSDFLVVMRKITDQQEQLEFERQTELIAQLGFSHAEASQFRDLFIMADEDSVGRLSFDQIKRMLCKSLRLSDLHLERLRTIFQQTLLRSGIRNEKAGYAEFLQIMSEVVQEDWCSQLP
ncbi:unnamed protein product [Durusdinium trenchii]|uniref:Calmodulin n=1 Tax=Durusdinium trenchii TaxID=1381693 RepID=A0ABP0IUV7_9DINO